MSEKPKKAEWFESWFDSKYYPILYKDRDQAEAQIFIDNLLKELKLQQNARILDLACGAGRHAIYLNSLGYDVTGIDLSEESIRTAKRSQNDTLSFFVHDMRDLYWDNYFDCILNLFTSFGYFENAEDNARTMNSISSSLRYGGRFVLDFMNSKKAMENLVLEEQKLIEGVNFHITRRVIEGRIFKRIAITDGQNTFTFEEKVSAFERKELEDMLIDSELIVEKVFENYQLNPFNEHHSDRLIIIARK